MQYGIKHHIDVPARAAGAVIFNDYGNVLLVQELKGSKSGLWHIPSGSVESGEFVELAAIREVEEETGLKVSFSGYLNTYVGCFDDGDLVLRHVWLAKYPEEQKVLPKIVDEIGSAKFFSESEVADLYKSGKLRMYHTKLMLDDAFVFNTKKS